MEGGKMWDYISLKVMVVVVVNGIEEDKYVKLICIFWVVFCVILIYIFVDV